jgi:EAL domain-containing protein (putative c-di-GMP-specific phosphodiesterase class I)
MRALRAIGVRFALDDFGLGHAPLACLRRLPLDELKIDRSFVRDVATDAHDAAIVRTIIGMAGALGMGVVAEGVEHPAQRDFLGRNGCKAFQGWLFGRPVPLADFEGALRLQPAHRVRTTPRTARSNAAAARSGRSIAAAA